MTKSEMLNLISSALYEQDEIDNAFIEDGRVFITDERDHQWMITVRKES